MNTNEMTPLDRVIQAERNEYHECDLKVWGITVEKAAAELSQLRATIERKNATIEAQMQTIYSLRSAAAELQAAHVYLDESYINDPNDPPLELADRCAQLVKTISEQARQLVKTISEQARQLNTARNVISAYRGLPTGPKGYTSMPLFDLHNAADDWLAANAPQPQEQSA